MEQADRWQACVFFIDGTYLKRIWGGEVKNVADRVAIGVAEDGYREVPEPGRGVRRGVP